VTGVFKNFGGRRGSSRVLVSVGKNWGECKRWLPNFPLVQGKKLTFSEEGREEKSPIRREANPVPLDDNSD